MELSDSVTVPYQPPGATGELVGTPTGASRKKGLRRSLLGAVALAIGALPMGGQALAQQGVLEEIVITAEFREARLQDTPIAITAFNADMLDARGQTSINEVAAQAPNVTLKPQPQGNGIGLVAFIRGIGQTDFNYALEPGVGVYVDDVYIPTLSNSLLDLMDLDRVEILRGPQGTLAGKNSIGGAIKLFTQKPTGEGTGSFEATYGSYDRIEFKGFADFAITDDLAARVSGMTQSRKGYITLLDYGVTHPDSNVPANNNAGKGGKLGTLGGISTQAGRISLRWTPSNRLTVDVAGDYTRERNDSGAQILLAGVDAPEDPTVGPNVVAGTNADGMPWLEGKDGTPIPADCRFVPAGPNSCSTVPDGYNPRFVNYANFLDGMEPTSQAPYKPYAAIPGSELDSWGLMSNVQFDLTDTLQLTWIQSWREYRSSWGEDQDGTPVPVAQLNQTLRHRAWSQEVRLNGELADSMIEYTLGGFWFDQDGELEARVDLNYAGIDFIHGPDTTPSVSKAAFLNTTFHVTDRWSITGGIRYSRDKKTYTYFRSNPDGSVPFEDWTPAQSPAPICEAFLGLDPDGGGPTSVGNTPNCLLTGLYNVSDTFKGSRWDWRAVTDYRFSDAFMAYASVSTGYKAGGVNPRPFFGPSAGECPPLDEVPRDENGQIIPQPACNQLRSFDPEEVTTYEVGFKTDLLERRLRLNGAVFYNDYKDIILTLPACPSSPCIQPRNVGKAEVKGAELEATFFPIESLSLDGTISYIDFDYKNTGPSGVPLDSVPPYTPELTYSFGIQYDADLANRGTLSFRFDGSYQDKLYTQPFNSAESRVDGYFLGNGRISYTSEDTDWQVALEVQNIFDKYYMHTKSDITDSLGLVTGQPGMPRTWAASVKRNF